MGTNELERNLPPIVLPPLRSKYFLENDPRKGKLTVEGDRITICGLADMLTIEMVDETYEGGRNEKGQPHGQGTYTFASGSEYQGEWKDGNMHVSKTPRNIDKRLAELVTKGILLAYIISTKHHALFK